MISRVVVVVVAVTTLVAMVLSDKMPAAQYKGDGRTGEVGDVAAELAESIPGTAGVDYPIFAQPPETSFVCEGYIQGYYADPEAQCQAFHICGDDGRGGLAKYSFLCPNGTVFNQQYFICDWWFNVDCSQGALMRRFLRMEFSKSQCKDSSEGEIFGSCQWEIMV